MMLRVTQGMLSNNSVKYLSQSYNKLAQLSDQMASGKKILKPSDDPVIAMNGMRFRSETVEIEQFKRNLNEGFNWMENADSALDETGKVLQRIRELTVQASNDSYTPSEIKNISDEIESLQKHIVSLAGTKVGETYIFSGTDTDKKPINENLLNIEFSKFLEDSQENGYEGYVISYQGQTFKYSGLDDNSNPTFTSSANGKVTVDSSDHVTYEYIEALEYRDGEEETFTKILEPENFVISHEDAVSKNTEDVEIEVMKGIKLAINIRPQNAYSIELFSGLESLKKMLNAPETRGADITKSLDSIDRMLDGVLSTRSELGARMNRAEMTENRLLEQEVIAKEMVSENEDVDLEEVIINLTIQQSVHQAALAVGAKIMQQSLVDYLR